MMHTMGYYIMSAVGNAIGASFSGSKHKNTYPKEPFFKKEYEDSLLTEEERYERDLRQALANEDAWIAVQKQKGLPETVA